LSWLRTEDRAALFTGAVLMRLAVILAGTLALMLGFGFGIGAVLGANVAAACITALTIAAAAIHFHGLSFDRTLFLRMWRFSLPLSVSAVGLFVIHFGDRFILKHYWSFADLGVYAVAYKLGMLLNPLQAAFESYWSAQAFQIVKRPDAEAIFARTLTYWALVLSACALALLVATRPALRILTTPAYFRAASLIPIVLAAYYVRALGDFFRIILLAKGLPSHDAAVNWITAAVSVASYFVLIPRYGITGAALATLFTFLVAFVISFVWSSRIWSFPLEAKRLSKLGVVTGALCVVYLVLPPVWNLMEVGRGLLLLMSFAGLLFLWRFLSPAEIDLLRSLRARAAAYHPW
jgi:O-antigen/teichoic acid export membrane protein